MIFRIPDSIIDTARRSRPASVCRTDSKTNNIRGRRSRKQETHKKSQTSLVKAERDEKKNAKKYVTTKHFYCMQYLHFSWSSKIQSVLDSIATRRTTTVSKSNDERFNLHSLWIHYSQSDKHANSIFDREGKWDRKYGEEMVVEHLNIPSTLNVPLHFPPQVFRQANLDAFTFIIAKIRSWLVLQQHLPKKCLELYGTLLHNFV